MISVNMNYMSVMKSTSRIICLILDHMVAGLWHFVFCDEKDEIRMHAKRRLNKKKKKHHTKKKKKKKQCEKTSYDTFVLSSFRVASFRLFAWHYFMFSYLLIVVFSRGALFSFRLVSLRNGRDQSL